MKIPRPALYVIAGLAVLALVVLAALSLRSAADQDPDEPTEPVVTTTDPPVSDGGGDASDGGGDDGDDLLYDGEAYSGPDEGLEEGSAADREASAAVAEKAASTWVNHDLTTEEWSKAMKPMVAPEAWEALNLPAPQRITPTEVTGEIADGPDGVSTETADYLIPTDAGDLSITLIKQGDDWKVSYIDKEL